MLKEDYNPELDKVILRRVGGPLTIYKTGNGEWHTPRACWDVRYDAYWLVERYRKRNERHLTYRFTGPIALPRSVVDMLPSMTEAERRTVQRHLPKDYTEAPYGIEYEEQIEQQSDGA